MKSRFLTMLWITLSLTLVLAGCNTGTTASTATTAPTLSPVPTSSATPSRTPTAEATVDLTAEVTPEGTFDLSALPTQIIVTVEPITGQRVPPPLDITLPEGWARGYETVLLQDLDGIRTYPVAVYTGPVTGGTGTIYLVWGFANLTAAGPTASAGLINLWSDGLRLWRLLITETGCNVGTDLQREYTVGGRTAVGTQVSAVDCPELPNVAGWFAGLQVDGLNFVFYATSDPQAMLGPAAAEMQGILDSVAFRVTDYLTATPPSG
ncbi:MAG: hypothetical protein SF029_16115 [bacterium]|nr:hypothetical protein [bacterium]